MKKRLRAERNSEVTKTRKVLDSADLPSITLNGEKICKGLQTTGISFSFEEINSCEFQDRNNLC